MGEILTCGRKGNGEVFRMSKYQSITEIFFNNKLVIKENILIEPLLIDVNVIGQLENFTHQASLVYLDENADIKSMSLLISQMLTSQSEIIFGITAASVNGLIIRILGHKAEQFYDCLKVIAGVLLSVNINDPSYAI